MAISSGHLDDLVGKTLTGLEDAGLTFQSATVTGPFPSGVMLSSVTATTTGTPFLTGNQTDTVTVKSVNDAQNSYVETTVLDGQVFGTSTRYIVGFSPNALLEAGNSSNVLAVGINPGSTGVDTDPEVLNNDASALGYSPIPAGTEITFTSTGTFTASVPAPSTSPITVSGGTYAITANSTTATAPGTASTLIDSTSGYNLIESQGNDTITAGGGYDTVFASGPSASVMGGTGHLVFVSGTGNYAAGGGSGSDTLYGGAGSDTLTGGTSGGSILVAGTGNATLNGGSADVMFGGTSSTIFNGSASGSDVMVGGAGADVFRMTAGDIAFGGAKGPDTFDAGAGSALIVEGPGTTQVVLGSGALAAFAGTGADTYTVAKSLGGSAEIVGFKPGDRIVLTAGFTAADASAAVSGATMGAFGTALALPDGTRITLFGASLSASQIGVG